MARFELLLPVMGERIRATGLNGRITKDDIKNYILAGRPDAFCVGIQEPVADPEDEVVAIKGGTFTITNENFDIKNF